MPTFDIRCTVCGREDEIVRGMNEINPSCIACGGKTETVFTGCQRPIWKCNPGTPGGGWTCKKPKRFLDGIATRKRGEGWKVEKHRT